MRCTRLEKKPQRLASREIFQKKEAVAKETRANDTNECGEEQI